MDLSKNVKRGLKTKAEKGVYVGSAKPGYMFDPLAKQGHKDLIPIPDTYQQVERAWRTILEGKYRVPEVLEMLNDDWGYRSPMRGKLGGKPMWMSEFYAMLRDPFYYGQFEYPTGSDIWHRWQGIPMLSEEQFMKVQTLLGGKGIPRPQHRTFAFTCMIKCVCGSSITAEEKWQVICTECRTKFTTITRDSCPKCRMKVTDMVNPTVCHYVYYHCSRKIDKNCTEKSVELSDLEPQVDEFLKYIGINEEFKQWALKYYNELNEVEVADRNVVIDQQQKNFEDCVKRLDNLVRLKISPANSDGSLLSDEEFKSQKEAIVKDKREIELLMGATGKRIENWIENLERNLGFAVQARYRFANGTKAEKRDILATIGSNMILEGKKLRLDVQKPYFYFGEIIKVEPTASAEFEPEKRVEMQPQLESLWASNPAVQERQDSNLEKQFWRLL